MNQHVEVDGASNLLEVATDHGIKINAVCQGRGTCGKCKVLITKGNSAEYSPEEIKHLTSEERKKGTRLACAINIVEDICVIVPREYQVEETIKKISQKSDMPVNKESDEELIDSYGIVFDIGTTSVEAALYHMSSQQEIIRITKTNPQSQYGADIITRISYSNQKKDNRERLTRLIRDCCNDIIDKIIEQNNIHSNSYTKKIEEISENIDAISYNKIHRCVFLGNTTMSHLFLGESVEGLARAPFTPSYSGMISWRNTDNEFHMSIQGENTFLPGLSGQVGSDTLGCILATNMRYQEGISIIVDIGTNSEVVLGINGEMVCCSSAAGPAFEGASISQGMRASIGGIKGAKINKGQLELDIIGNGHSIGICGSGIIDIIGELVEEGIIDETGRIISPEETESPLRDRIITGESNTFLLSSPWDKVPVKIIQKDIREVQMAKAAIYAGIMTLLEENNIAITQIDRVYLAGAFGNNINIKNAIKIGLLPALPIEKYKFIGNGSLEGGALLLLSKVSKEEVIYISENMNHIELANNDYFRELFVQSMNFKK